MANFKDKIKAVKSWQPLDRVAIISIVILTIITFCLLVGGTIFGGKSWLNMGPKVANFSWQNKQIGVEDKAFILTFTRAMNHESVQKNIRIEPPLNGKFSWTGKRMAYTLEFPAPYGTTYSLQLQDGTEQFYGQKADKIGRLMEPFTGYFRTRDRAFSYIGLGGETDGRLMIVNLTSEEPKPMAITPKELIVTDYKSYPKGDKILFSAVPRNQQASFLDQELYTVTTGLNSQAVSEDNNQHQSAGNIEKILDAKTYQNLKFDLSPDGKIIVIQRSNRQQPAADTVFWMIKENSPPERLQNAKGENIRGGNFLIAPDSNSLAILQGEGSAIIPLQNEAEALGFLPKFGNILSFAPDGSAAAMVKYNPDGTRSLFIVNNQGTEQEILRTKPYGNIITAEFDDSKTTIYCLMVQLIQDEEGTKEQPYIAAINLKEGKLKPLVILPNRPEINMDLSPDNLAIIFDQEVKIKEPENQVNSEAIKASGTQFKNSTSKLWFLSLPDALKDNSQVPYQPEELPFNGFQPHWLP